MLLCCFLFLFLLLKLLLKAFNLGLMFSNCLFILNHFGILIVKFVLKLCIIGDNLTICFTKLF